MEERPPQPAEGKLIADTLALSGMSIRRAAKRAGISYGRWRQITSGYQNVSPGSYAAVRGPALTVARMAHVVGLGPDDLHTAGREDAAVELQKIIQQGEPPEGEPAGHAVTGLTEDEAQIVQDFVDMIRRSAAQQAERRSGRGA
jgi:hypothetical protein